MQDMMLLDRRTKDLVKEYVPTGDVLDSIVFFSFCRPDTGTNVVRSGNIRNVRNRPFTGSGNKSDHGIAPASATEKSGYSQKRAFG